MARTVAIVPHTHWDREWYEPFQKFRLRLVEAVDEILDLLEADLSYFHFTLDGQMAAIDDYLEVRPGAEPRIRALVAAGRLSVGPWYVLPDEFLVSGETLVRNLEFGLERAAALGGGLEVGYLPDMFGHVAQMPQILRLGGFTHAVLWRGVPAAVNRTAFWWTAPDGSTVRAEYLPVGYGNGAAVPNDAKRLAARIRAHEAELGELLAHGSPMLWMNGGDHQLPQSWLGRVVAETNDIQDDYRIKITSLHEYLEGAPTTDLPEWSGELRSGARANLLMGVASNRVDVKQAAAGAERALEQMAEPLCALFLPADRWPAAPLKVAWRAMLRNAAHDSICACSADDVVAAVLHRYAEARHIGDALAAEAVAAVGRSVSFSGPVVINPAARPRSGVVELVLSGDTPPPSAQVISSRPPTVTERVITGAEAGIVLGQLRNNELAQGCDFSAVALEPTDDRLEVTIRSSPSRPGVTDSGEVRSSLSELYAEAGARRRGPVHLRVEYDGYARVLAFAGEVPGFGWQAWEAAPLPVPAARASGRSMSNGVIEVEVDAGDGTFSIGALAGLDLLVDDGDGGDTYNYSPPEQDAVVDAPTAVGVTIEEDGPLRAALRVTRCFEWPERIIDGARVGQREAEVSTRLELRAGEPFVRVTTTLDNPCRDHRLRAWFPLPDRADNSVAETAFGTVTREALAEGGPHEKGLPTFPSRRFVAAGGLTIAHHGLPEYELVDGGKALAMTLLRCTGLLSGTAMEYRPLPAGPPLPVEGAQMAGRHEFRYAVATGDVDPYALVDDVFLPMVIATASGTGERPHAGSALSVEGAEVSAVRRTGASLEVRVFNPSGRETAVDLGPIAGWLVDLRGRPLERFHGSFALRAWGIATARLDPQVLTEGARTR